MLQYFNSHTVVDSSNNQVKKIQLFFESFYRVDTWYIDMTAQGLTTAHFFNTGFHDGCLNEQNTLWLTSCTSTSDILKNAVFKGGVFNKKQNNTKKSNSLKKRNPLPCVCISDTQSAGRGQHGRHWQSALGHLYFSIALPLKKTAPLTGMLSLEIALALIHTPTMQDVIAIHRTQNPYSKLGIKWPNDLVASSFDKSGAVSLEKFAGILVEPIKTDDESGVIIGIGINCAMLSRAQKSRIQTPATSLTELSGVQIDLPKLAAEVAHACIDSVSKFSNKNSVPILSKALNQPNCEHQSLPKRFSRYDVLFGRKIIIKQSQNNAKNAKSAHEGVAKGIADDGALKLQTATDTLTLVYDGRISLIA